MPTVTYPVTALIFDGVTLGAFGDIPPDATLLLGSADGLDDYGRTRVQNVATSTTIPVGRISQGVEDGSLNVVDNAYITVLYDFRVWAKIPYDAPSGVDYKDSDVAVLAYNVDIPPVANMGPGFAAYTSGGVITVAFDGTPSYAMADGATIATYAWDIEDGTLTVGTLASSTITVTFPAGFRYVALTVVDSNGVPMTTRRGVLAVNAAADVTANERVDTQRLTIQGQTLTIPLLNDKPRLTYPDGTLVMFWWDAPSSPSDRSHMKFIGWIQGESASIRATKTGFTRETTLTCVDVAGRLDSLPGFPQALQREDEDDVDEMWSLMPGLDINKALHYLIFWHSTALGVADFFLAPTGSDFPSMRLDSVGSSLYDQVNSRALSLTPDHHLACNSRGQLSVLADWMYMDVGDRPTTAGILTEDDWSDIRFDYTRPPRVHVLRSSAVVASTDWLMIGGEKTLPLAFSIAPGNAFSQGTSEAVEAEGLTISQDDLNVATGHRYARLNARYGPLPIDLAFIDAWDYEPALMQRIQLNVGAIYAAQRGLDFTTAQGIVKELTFRYNSGKTGTSITPTLSWERETSGFPAVTHVPEDTGDVPDYETPPVPPPTVPPDFGLVEGMEQLVGIGIDGHVYRTADFQTPSGSGGPTYDDVDLGIGTVYSWVVDPFSPGYAPGATTGAINGFEVTDTDIYRVVDLFGTPVATSVFTFPTATVAASFHWRSIQASFGAYFAEGVNPWLLCISYYGTTTGHTGTWATYSTDGGVTWSAEVQVSALYDTEVATRFNPIGVFTSPRTPGYALTAAHTPLEEDPAEPLPHWGLWDEDLGELLSISAGGAFDYSIQAESVNGEGLVETTEWRILLAPPANAVRVLLNCSYYHNRTQSGASGGFSHGVGYTLGRTPIANLSETETLTFNSGVTNGAPSIQDYTVEWTRTSGTDWPGNRDELPGVNDFADFARWRMYVSAATSGTKTALAELRHTATVVEIELEGGHIYTPLPSLTGGGGFASSDWGASWAASLLIQPGMAQAGSIHIPWPANADEGIVYYGNTDFAANRQFRLKRATGGVDADVSPLVTGVSYGVNRGPFGARTFDNDRTYLLLAGIGNDTTADAADDLHGVFVSDDEGATWTTIVTPISDAGAPTGRPAFEAAFGGDTQDVIFIWGPAAYVSYSSNFGVAVDSRAGNLGALGASGWVGLAGGPG